MPGDRHGADRAAGRKNQYAKIQVFVIVMLAQRLEQQTCQAMVSSSNPASFTLRDHENTLKESKEVNI